MAAGISLSLLGPAGFPVRSSGVCVLSSGPSPGSCCPCRFAGTQSPVSELLWLVECCWLTELQ